MKNIVKKNQIIITALSIMIAVAGYLNFSNRELTVSSPVVESDSSQENNTEVKNTNGENVEASTQESVDTMDISNADEVALNAGAKGNQDDAEVSAPVTDQIGENSSQAEIGEAVLTEAGTADFITKAKLAREQTRAKSKEMLMNMIENDKIGETGKKEAEQKILQLSDDMEMESQIEQLLGAKGFTNAVVSISNGNADVLLNQEKLSDVEKAQVEDIVMRKTGLDMDKIVISTIKNQK